MESNRECTNIFKWGVKLVVMSPVSRQNFDINLSAMNQLVLYTKGNTKEVGNIIDISMKEKGTRPLYKINIKGG